MFDLLLESFHRDDSNKRSNIGFGKEIMELASIEVNFTHIIWSSEYTYARPGVSVCVTGVRKNNKQAMFRLVHLFRDNQRLHS